MTVAQNIQHLGVCGYSYSVHWKAARDGSALAPFKGTLEFIDYCHQLGAGGVQVSVGSKEADYPKRVRAKIESHGMYFEGQANLPQQQEDIIRFETDVLAAKEAGAEVIRAALLSGRRYETFDSEEVFRQFEKRSWQSLTLAEPVVKKHRVRLAIENHKDFRAAEFLELLKRLGSDHVGVCVDTGNNLALLEEPLAVVRALAPVAFSTHIKDMAVQEYEGGFLLSEVPLGEGFLDLKEMIALLRQANPKVQFNLEMITRDPLKIPCLTRQYWATMPTLAARELAAALDIVRRNSSRKPLPHTSGLASAEQLALEDEHVRKCFDYARRELAF